MKRDMINIERLHVTSQVWRLVETCGKMCGIVNGTKVISRHKFVPAHLTINTLAGGKEKGSISISKWSKRILCHWWRGITGN